MKKEEGILFKYRILWHVLFWIVWYLFYSITYGGYQELYKEELIINAVLMPVRMAATYSFIYFLLPKFLFKRQYTAFFILTIVHVSVYAISLWTILYYFAYCKGCYYEHNFPTFFYLPKILGVIIGNYGIPATAAIIKLFKMWYNDQQKNQVLISDKLEAELKFLKSQINPHFLFNTLNNLYALTLKKSEDAPDVVLKLSGMLDYMLYNSNEQQVCLKDEIKLLRDYIELEKIRYGSRLNLNFNIKGDTEGKKIAPLILLPFIENSFKHGVSKDTKEPYIDIDLAIETDCLKLKVCNSVCKDCGNGEKYTEGIGLKNVQRRLQLLYADHHDLKISDKDNSHCINLCISWSVNILTCLP